MDYAIIVQRLHSVLRYYLLLFAAAWCFSLPAGLHFMKKRKPAQKKSRPDSPVKALDKVLAAQRRPSLGPVATFVALALATLLFLGPLCADAIEGSILSYDTSCYTSINCGLVAVEIDGEEVRLMIPLGYDTSSLPTGTTKGRVWYTQRSQYLLAFVPDEGAHDEE